MSNCLNSKINKISIMTQFNSASLNRHISRTYNFSNGIKFGGGFVEVLAATQTPGETGKNWFQDVKNKEIEHIVVLSGDQLYRMNYMNFVQVRSHSYLMGHDVLEADQVWSNSYSVKAHSSLCWELTKILDKIFCVLPAIELAQPGGKSGIKELCSLNNTIEKSKLLLQHCAESSKLYLAITGKETVLRCERIRTALDKSLCRIMDMVSSLLAAQIAVVVDYLRGAKFIIDSTDEEAGKSLLELFRQSDPSVEIELEAYRVAALKLNITSSMDLLIEKRSVKKLIDKINDEKNERKLSYLLYLLKKYGKKVGPDVNENKENTNNPGMISDTSSSNSREKGKSSNPPEGQPDSSITDLPPEEFCCPLSLRLMQDPVVISSGQTYERKCIEKWFEDGHDTCPKTQNRLNNLSLVPNTCMKDLIYLWYHKHVVSIHNPLFQPNFALCHSWESSQEHSTSSSGNISATLFYGETDDLRNNHSNISFISYETSCYSDSSLVKEVDISDYSHVEMFPWSDDYQKFQSFSNFSHDMFIKFFHGLSELPSELKGKTLKILRTLLEDNDEFHCAILSNRFFDALTNFLQDAKEKSDVQALKIGAQILLSFFTNSRKRSPSSIELKLLISFLDYGITLEVLTIIQKLTHQPNWMSHMDASNVSSITKILESQDAEYLELALRILYNLSSHSEIKPHLSSCGCISRLTTLLNKVRLSGICIKLMRNLSDIDEAASMIAQTDGCLASIAELLETGSCEEKEHAAAIIHSLCCRSPEYCQLVMKEGIIPSLVDISINGNSEGREISLKLLQLLRDRSADFREELQLQSPMFTSGLTMNLQSESCMSNSGLSTDDLQENDRRTWPTSKSSSFFERKVLRFFSKPRSLV